MRVPLACRGLGLTPLLALALVALAGAGCHGPITEVVLVLDSDLVIPTEADSLQLTAMLDDPSSAFTTEQAGTGLVEFSRFPVSVGFVSSSGDTPSFSVVVELDRIAGLAQQQIVLRRTITGIAFVKEQIRMLIVPLSKVCACQGTTCPNPGNPDCDDIANPDTEPFDPSRAPPSSAPMPQFTVGGPTGPGVFNTGQTRPTTPLDGGSGPPAVDAAMRVAGDSGVQDVRSADGALPDGNGADGGALDAGGGDATGGEAGAPDGGVVAEGGVG